MPLQGRAFSSFRWCLYCRRYDPAAITASPKFPAAWFRQIKDTLMMDCLKSEGVPKRSSSAYERRLMER